MLKSKFEWALVLLVASSCSSGPGGAGGHGGNGGTGVLCIPGASVACVCTNGEPGAQVCNAAGSGLDACVCSGGGGAGGAGTAGRGGAGGISGAGGATGGATAGTTGTGGRGGAAGISGTGGSTGGATAGTTGTGGTPVSCQASFGTIGQGDANPSFQSGVGALGANAMYIFSGFTSAAGAQNVYVQAFDPKTGASKGASQALFATPTLGFESANYVGGSVYLYAAAVADTGNVALAYRMTNKTTSNGALYVAFLNPTTGAGGVQGLALDHVELVSTTFTAGASGDQNNPKLFWSNASRTFVVNYASPAPQQPLPTTTAVQISLAKYTVGGQSAGGIAAVPVPASWSSIPQAALISNGGVGESGNLLGVQYTGWNGTEGTPVIAVLDENQILVGTPRTLTVTGNAGWQAVAGTANGFVSAFPGLQYVNVMRVPTSGGSVAADAGVQGSSLTSLTMRTTDGRAIADDVGTGGKGGVGLALVVVDGRIAFVYVNSDGTIEGPSQAFAAGGTVGAMSMTNFNGRFAISTYDSTAHAAQVVATGGCP